MSSWYEQAAAKLKAEYSQVKGPKEQAMRPAVRDVLLEFCRQDEEFAQAVCVPELMLYKHYNRMKNREKHK